MARPSHPRIFAPAARRGRTAPVFGVEGGDFIEDQPERVSAAFADGVRVITLVHYHVNQIGDIQTEPPVHRGLTALGADIVRAMNATGILIDLAHATLEVTRDVVQISQVPVMISHTNLVSEAARHPRLITLEQAKLVTDRGGLIGSVPWGVAQKSFADYIDSLLRLSAAVGVDHVAVGTDMDATIRPVLKNYRDWSLLPAALLAKRDARARGRQDHGREFPAGVRGGDRSPPLLARSGAAKCRSPLVCRISHRRLGARCRTCVVSVDRIFGVMPQIDGE